METRDTTAPAGCPVDHAAAAAPAAAAVPAATAIGGPRAPLAAQTLGLYLRPTRFMRRCKERYGDRFELKIIPGATVYVLSSPEDVKAMFLAPRDTLHTGKGSDSLEKFFGQSGLAFLDEDEHLARRKAIMPSVKGKALQRIEASVTTMAKEAVAGWPKGKAFSLHPYAHRFTVQVIREVVFGTKVPSCWDELYAVVWDMLRFNRHVWSVVETHNIKPRTHSMLKAIRPLGFHRFARNRAHADALIAQAVAERLESGESGDDMLSMLLSFTHPDGTALTGTEIRDEIMTMFLAGTETTAAGICWALEYLSRTPAAVERIRAEIADGAGDPYLTGVVNEALRLRPPTPQIIPREVVKPIEINGVRYEPGSWLWASGYLLHHDPQLYPDPEEFRPERWFTTKPSAHTWIPFGGGHTRCLGDRVGLLELKAVLREALTSCELGRPDPKPEEPRSRSIVVMLSQHGTRLHLRPRTAAPSLASEASN